MPKKKAVPASTPTQRRVARRAKYNAAPLTARLNQLLEQNNETYREAAIKAGLDHLVFNRIMRLKMQPTVQTCILLGEHFGINPNELLQLAGHYPLKAFDVQTASAERLPPEAVKVAVEIARIKDPGLRRKVAEAITTLLAKHFDI